MCASRQRRRRLEKKHSSRHSINRYQDIGISSGRVVLGMQTPRFFVALFQHAPFNEVFQRHRRKGRPRGYCLLDISNPISTIATFFLRNPDDAPSNALTCLQPLANEDPWLALRPCPIASLRQDLRILNSLYQRARRSDRNIGRVYAYQSIFSTRVFLAERRKRSSRRVTRDFIATIEMIGEDFICPDRVSRARRITR